MPFNGSKLEPDRAKKDGSWGLRHWLEKHSFSVFVRKLLSLAPCGAQYITGTQSELVLKLVLILGKGRLMKASLVFPMTLSCELSLPRAVSHSALLVVQANKPERAVLIPDTVRHHMAVSERCTRILSERDDDASVLCCVSHASMLSPARLTSKHVQSDFAIF